MNLEDVSEILVDGIDIEPRNHFILQLPQLHHGLSRCCIQLCLRLGHILFHSANYVGYILLDYVDVPGHSFLFVGLVLITSVNFLPQCLKLHTHHFVRLIKIVA